VCSGQIYYDLIEEEKREASKTSLSAEWKQIAPFPFDRIQHMGAKYSKAA
jgi:2-oxoglutarate dehydrogenase complex dehydrogenase (E1) component-like enzyme